MRKRYGLRAVKIGDGSGHTENAGAGSGRKRQRLHGIAEKSVFLISQTAAFVKQPAGQIGVGAAVRVPEPLTLHVPRPGDPLPDLCGRRTGSAGAHLLVGDGRHLHMKIDAVQKRT